MRATLQPAMRGRLVSDIFREIDEELRRDNLLKLWQRYGKYVIALAVVLVVATALVVGWREYRLRQRQAEGVRYAAALDLVPQGKTKDAAAAFAAMAQTATGGPRACWCDSRRRRSKAKSGDRCRRRRDLRPDRRRQRLDAQIYRDLADLAGRATSRSTRTPRRRSARLKPLTDAGNPWHAIGARTDRRRRARSRATRPPARKTYQPLADDLTAPQGVRARAAEMVAALGP